MLHVVADADFDEFLPLLTTGIWTHQSSKHKNTVLQLATRQI